MAQDKVYFSNNKSHKVKVRVASENVQNNISRILKESEKGPAVRLNRTVKSTKIESDFRSVKVRTCQDILNKQGHPQNGSQTTFNQMLQSPGTIPLPDLLKPIQGKQLRKEEIEDGKICVRPENVLFNSPLIKKKLPGGQSAKTEENIYKRQVLQDDRKDIKNTGINQPKSSYDSILNAQMESPKIPEAKEQVKGTGKVHVQNSLGRLTVSRRKEQKIRMITVNESFKGRIKRKEPVSVNNQEMRNSQARPIETIKKRSSKNILNPIKGNVNEPKVERLYINKRKLNEIREKAQAKEKIKRVEVHNVNPKSETYAYVLHAMSKYASASAYASSYENADKEEVKEVTRPEKLIREAEKEKPDRLLVSERIKSTESKIRTREKTVVNTRLKTENLRRVQKGPSLVVNKKIEKPKMKAPAKTYDAASAFVMKIGERIQSAWNKIKKGALMNSAPILGIVFVVPVLGLCLFAGFLFSNIDSFYVDGTGKTIKSGPSGSGASSGSYEYYGPGYPGSELLGGSGGSGEVVMSPGSDGSVAVAMATKMNKLDVDYWDNISMIQGDRSMMQGVEGFRSDLDIPAYSRINIEFYDAYGKKVEKNNTTNNKAVMSLASCYQMEVNGMKRSVDYQDYCTFLWIASHEFTLKEDAPYKCNVDQYEIETHSRTHPPSMPSKYCTMEDLDSSSDIIPKPVWCPHGHWNMDYEIPHEHYDSDGDVYYTYTYMWRWKCDQHINATMQCTVSDLILPKAGEEDSFDWATYDDRIYDADFIGTNLTNETIEGYLDENGAFDVDAWIENFKPDNFDKTAEWLTSMGNTVPDLKTFICSKVRGTYKIKNDPLGPGYGPDSGYGPGFVKNVKEKITNLFSMKAYASEPKYVWRGWDDSMKELAELRTTNSYSAVTRYDNLLNGKIIHSGASTEDYRKIAQMIMDYRVNYNISDVQMEVLKLALQSVGNIPYYFGGGHPGGGADQIGYPLDDEGNSYKVQAEGDPESWKGRDKPPELRIIPEEFYTKVGTDWYGRTERGLDCSAFVWFLYAQAGHPFSEEPFGTSDAIKYTLYPVTTKPQPGDLYIVRGHVKIYMGNPYEASCKKVTDNRPIFIELAGRDESVSNSEKIGKPFDTVYVTYGESSGYIYMSLKKYYDVYLSL